MNKIPILLVFIALVLSSCVKDNPKQLTKDLVKGGRWNITAFSIEEYNNPTGWQEEIVFDTLIEDAGYMEFFDDDGDFGPTYRMGNFKFKDEDKISFNWDAYGPPSSDEIPVMYFVFSKPWRDFRQNYEHKAELEIWEDDKIKLRFDLGNLGANNNHVIYKVVLVN